MHYLIKIESTFQWESVYRTQELDDECVTEMAVSVGKSRKVMHKILSDWLYDYNTATYLLLWQRKQRSKSIRLATDQVFIETYKQDWWKVY